MTIVARLVNVFHKYRASRHIARLFSDDMSERQVLEIQRWSDSEAEYQGDFLTTLHALADIEGLADDPDIRSVANQTAPVGLARKAAEHWPGLAAAAGVVLALVIGLGGFIGQKPWESFETSVLRYVTRVGEQKTINLEDGSVITLNTGTQLLVDLNRDARYLTLERGEVFFDVAPDPERPFTVDMGERSVTVLGTAFNIFKSPEKFTLTVVEGEVAVHRGEEQVSSSAIELAVPKGKIVKIHSPDQRRVKAGTVVEFDAGGKELLAYTPSNIERLYSWRTGLLQFEEEPLYKVVQELNRYSGKKILIEDASVMDLKVYASVRVANSDMALTGLEKMLPIKVVRHFDRIVIKNRE